MLGGETPARSKPAKRGLSDHISGTMARNTCSPKSARERSTNAQILPCCAKRVTRLLKSRGGITVAVSAVPEIARLSRVASRIHISIKAPGV